jgi:hypothetical protein
MLKLSKRKRRLMSQLLKLLRKLKSRKMLKKPLLLLPQQMHRPI